MESLPQSESASRLSEILSEQQAAALEQLEQVLEERFTEIARRVGVELEAVLDAARGDLPTSAKHSTESQSASRAARRAVEPLGPGAALCLRAQRFARVKVAEMRLYQAGAVDRGRAARNLYAELRSEIDSARWEFQREFLSADPSMADHLHLELVRTLAHDDVALLGEDYPGPLA